MLSDVEGTVKLSFAFEEAGNSKKKLNDYINRLSGKKQSVQSLISGS